MVNPIAAGTSSVPLAVPNAATERPAALPEPARQVTATDQTLSSGSSTTSKREQELNPENLDPLGKALEAINNNMEAWSTGMRFDMDEEAQRMVVSIVDSKSGEVLRTVPSEAVIRVAKMIVQLQGRSIDTKA